MERGYEWNCISRSNRLLLGTLFLSFVKKLIRTTYAS